MGADERVDEQFSRWQRGMEAQADKEEIENEETAAISSMGVKPGETQANSPQKEVPQSSTEVSPSVQAINARLI